MGNLILFLIIQIHSQYMQGNIRETQPCKVVIIGLPCSGKHQVAKILQEKHGCKLLDVKGIQHKKQVQMYKTIGNLCFQNYEQKTVIVLDRCDSKTLHHLKKRNFVNIIFIDAPFKQRFKFYCQINQKKADMEAYEQFSSIDAKYQNQDYQKCLQFVSLRLYNDKDIKQLQEIVRKNIQQIVRPFRPDYDEYFMKIAEVAKRRSNCMKSSVGCVIVNDNNRVVSTGYNGTPRGLPSCYKNGCKRCNQNEDRGLDECLCLHGEQSAILEVGILRTFGCKLYTTLYPCFSCAKIIKQAGIKKIFYLNEYDKQDNGARFLKQNYKQQDVVHLSLSNLYY